MIRFARLFCIVCFGVWCLLAPRSAAAQAAGSELVGSNIASFDDLIAILAAEKINHDPHPEQQFVIVPVRKDGLESPQVIRWALQDGVVHFIQVIPLQVPPERIAAMESSMIRLNHAFPVPGLGLNHENNTPYFRLTVPLLPRGNLSEIEVKEYFSFCVSQAIQFYPTLEKIATGEIQPEKALDSHRRRIEKAIGPIGKWSRSFGGNDYVMTIAPNGEVTLLRDGEVMVDSMAKVSKTEITFEDVNGPLAVDGPGKYSYTIEDGQKMIFTTVEDGSSDRQQVLTGGEWTR